MPKFLYIQYIKKLICREGIFLEDTACFYVAEITLALEHLHRQVGNRSTSFYFFACIKLTSVRGRDSNLQPVKPRFGYLKNIGSKYYRGLRYRAQRPTDIIKSGSAEIKFYNCFLLGLAICHLRKWRKCVQLHIISTYI